jgi:hypothetical protein
VPFSDVIFYATGKKVLAVDRADETDQRMLKQIGTAPGRDPEADECAR